MMWTIGAFLFNQHEILKVNLHLKIVNLFTSIPQQAYPLASGARMTLLLGGMEIRDFPWSGKSRPLSASYLSI